ncbi:unnamed protein product [Litomosoides sigmodontis]|uniref:Uncharacterized protein n=1 Tax=Litomosoides sigmodontis TaxID=42156 RepID=A0A3P6UNT2_LITSI|nr:unnamed protein product [Litomosoides sigmodontis]
MCASKTATHNLVLSGITDSGTVIVNGVVLDSCRLSTTLSFHHIESVAKFTVVEETSTECEQTSCGSDVCVGAPAATPVFQSGSVSDETVSAAEQWENCRIAAGMDLEIQAQSETSHEQDIDMMKPIASSDLFERKRTSSQASALLSEDREPGYKAYVQFVSPSGVAQIEACDNEEQLEGMERSVESVIGRLLFTLSSLKMNNPDRHAAAVRRLQDLEEELRAAGAVCPPDTAASNAVSSMLASASPTSDIQIRVNSSQYSTTTKSVFETDTPGMEGLDPATVQHLQQQLISNMSVPETPLSFTEQSTPTVTDQKHETMAEGFTSEDGSVVVSKKMTRVVTTTRTTLPGENTEANAGDLIRLKVNEQVYSGSVDPGDQHIHLVPITKQQQKLDSIEQQQ